MSPILSLVIVFCHFAEPVECKVVRVTPEATTPIGCIAEGEERAVEWLKHEPDGWEVVRGICEQNVARQSPA